MSKQSKEPTPTPEQQPPVEATAPLPAVPDGADPTPQAAPVTDSTPDPFLAPATGSDDPAGAPNPAPAAAPTTSRARQIWRQATATTGARVATIIALSLATLLTLGGLTAAVAAIAHHDRDDRGWNQSGPKGGMDRGNGHGMDRGQGNGHGMDQGHGNGMGQGRGNGMDRGNSGPGGTQPFGPNNPGQGPDLGAPGMPGAGGNGLGGLLMSATHGEVTTADGTVYVFQRGAVTASSATSITLKSSDGFSATYAIASGVSPTVPAVDAQALVLAKKDGNSVVLLRGTGAGAIPQAPVPN